MPKKPLSVKNVRKLFGQKNQVLCFRNHYSSVEVESKLINVCVSLILHLLFFNNFLLSSILCAETDLLFH